MITLTKMTAAKNLIEIKDLTKRVQATRRRWSKKDRKRMQSGKLREKRKSKIDPRNLMN